MRLPTKTKLFVASLLCRLAKRYLRLQGLNPSSLEARRGGVTWHLDLNQGIDLSLYLFGYFEKDVSTALKEHVSQGITVFDVGANIGAHTLPIASFVGSEGSVYSFEPTKWAYDKMKVNLALNPELSPRVIPVFGALVQPGGAIPQEIYSSWPVGHHKGDHPVHAGDKHSTDGALTITLDEFVEQYSLERLDLIKLDVDGFETQVLRGASNTLERFKPLLILELCEYTHQEHGESFEGLLQLLESLGYRIFSLNSLREMPLEAEELREHIPSGGGINVLARPS